jgi:branched-chain amino acid aminotransferase
MTAGTALSGPASTELLTMIDGRYVSSADAVVSLRDIGFLRGDGVFEVFRTYGGRPFAVEEHLARLARSASGIDLHVDTVALAAEVEDLCGRIGPRDVLVRVVCTRDGHRYVLEEPMLVFPERIRLAVVPHLLTPVLRTSAGTLVKSLSYAANMHAKRTAESRGYDDALLVTPDGYVLEGPFTGFAWVQDGAIFTPPLGEGILDSITRGVLLEVTDAEERRCTLDDLRSAEDACILGTAMEVLPVAEIEGINAFPATGPVLAQARAKVAAAIQATLDRQLAPMTQQA